MQAAPNGRHRHRHWVQRWVNDLEVAGFPLSICSSNYFITCRVDLRSALAQATAIGLPPNSTELLRAKSVLQSIEDSSNGLHQAMLDNDGEVARFVAGAL